MSAEQDHSNVAHAMQPDDSPELRALYKGFEDEHLMPLWTQLGDLMPMHPKPKAVPHVWKWSKLLPLAEKSGELVPVGRGGERRAIGLANPGLGGNAYVSPTLWAAIQYLGPKETAPEHRHAQNAFRFVVEGEGVWTVVCRAPPSIYLYKPLLFSHSSTHSQSVNCTRTRTCGASAPGSRAVAFKSEKKD